MQKVIDQINAAGFSVVEHTNRSGNGETTHLTIIGGARRVEYYHTSGTVFANKTRTLKQIMVKSGGVEKAILLAKNGVL